MTAFAELGQSLHEMGFPQLVFMLAFLASYALTLTGLPGARAERCAIVVAWLSAAGFVALTDPWMHGVMLTVFIVGVMGLFIAAVWALNALFGLVPNEAAHVPRALLAGTARAVPSRETVQTAH